MIKILGGGCQNCLLLEKNVMKAVAELQIGADIIKITDFQDILQYDIMATPGLVINEKLVSSGKVLKVKEIISLIK
ncbi:MAG TPA: thioredoxin family protein [Ruminococcaceae bacterium]|nr:thioredoxin family protein [Oscillospiraceae bacterium]